MSENRDVLAQAGIYYPETLHDLFRSHSQHRYLFVGAQGSQYSAVNHLMEDIRRNGAAKNIVSEENLSWRSHLNASFLSPLAEFFEIKVICMIRRQDLLVESLYSQMLRGGYRGTFSEFIGSEDILNLLDYSILMSHWSSIFGEENIIALRFMGRIIPTENILFSTIGIPNYIELAPVPEQNLSISFKGLQFIRCLQDRGVNFSYASFNELFGNALVSATRGPAAKYFSDLERQNFLDAYVETNAKLAADFFPTIEEARLFEGITNQEGVLPEEARPLSEDEQLEIYREMMPKASQKSLSEMDAMLISACESVFVPDIVS